jgi:uncharacterized LabA/DUF88 family protein
MTLDDIELLRYLDITTHPLTIFRNALGATGRLRAALSFLGGLLKTIVYVDGYNLYYGLLRRSEYKWLDLYKLFSDNVLNSDADVVEVRYYTAPVLGRMCDDPKSPGRQRTYLAALKKMPPSKVTIIEGKHAVSKPFQRLVSPIPERPDLQRVQVYDFNEKHTDVNIAVDIVAGAWTAAYEQVVLCTNDTDVIGALVSVRQSHPDIRIGIVAPVSGDDHRRISADLMRLADWSKKLSTVHLANSQLPEKIPGSPIRKPTEWGQQRFNGEVR